MTRFFDGSVKWPDNILTVGQFSILVHPSFKILAYRAASDSHIIPINAIILEQVMQNLCNKRQIGDDTHDKN